MDYATENFFGAVDDAGGTVARVKHVTEAETDEFLVIGRTDDQVVDALLE